MRGLNSPTTEKWTAPLWTRRRMLMLAGGFTATLLLLLHISTITYNYGIPHPSFATSSSASKNKTTPTKRMVMEDLLNPSYTILRPYEPSTSNFGSRYRFVKDLANGFEGAARIYEDMERGGKQVIIKSWFKSTRQEPVPQELKDRLQNEFQISVTEWPVEISTTLHDYQSPFFAPSDHSISHALDAFYTDVPADGPEFGWRIVLPMYSFGTLEHSIQAVSYLNLSIEDIDWLYRPRYRRVWQMLAKLNTAAEPENGNVGYCHEDVKADNIFHLDEMGNELLGDLGQVRPFNSPFHEDWKDCRLVDSQRAWRTYSWMLRWGQNRLAPVDERFEKRLWEKKDEWAKAHFQWYDTLYTALETLQNDPFWKNMQTIWKRSSIRMPVWRNGQKTEAWLSRDAAFVEIDKIRVEMMRVRKEEEENRKLQEKHNQKEEEMKKNGEPAPAPVQLKPIDYPWFWWDMPGAPADGDIDRELAVYWANSKLIGAGRSWELGMTAEDARKHDEEEAKKKEEEERKKEEEGKKAEEEQKKQDEEKKVHESETAP